MATRTSFFSFDGQFFRKLQSEHRLSELVLALDGSLHAEQVGLREGDTAALAEGVGSLDEVEELLRTHGPIAGKHFGRELTRSRALPLSAPGSFSYCLAFDVRAALLTLESHARLVSAVASPRNLTERIGLLRFSYPYQNASKEQQVALSTIVSPSHLPSCQQAVSGYFDISDQHALKLFAQFIERLTATVCDKTAAGYQLRDRVLVTRQL